MALASLQRASRAALARTQQSLTGLVSGHSYQLGPEVGAGGEGIVYSVVGRQELLAKVYRHTPNRVTIDKLGALVRGTTPGLLAVAAVPTECLRSSSGTVVGFVMPRIADARGIHELYSPRARLRHFPSADFHFLIHVAANVARLVAAAHAADLVIGDVNHGNILVRNDGTVAAIDCDSFQVGDGSRYPCGVGVELFTPPELLGKNLSSLARTPNHDAFGLAVLIFHLLFMGRHPFAGRYLCHGEMPIEMAIAESRFAYSPDTRRTRMGPPPLTLPFAGAGLQTAELFERAFHPDGRNGNRPTPEDWIRVLEALKGALFVCASVPWHQYVPNLPACPWCTVERASGVKLFGGLARPASAPIVDLPTLWARYRHIADPGAPQPLPREEDWVPPPGTATWKYRLTQRHARLAGGFACLAFAPFAATIDAKAATLLVLLAAAIFIIENVDSHSPKLPPSDVLDAFIRADKVWQALAHQWQAQPAPPDSSSHRQAIDALKAKLDALGPEREARIRALARVISEAEQRADYLGQFRIETAGLFNIGAARCAVLRSWGIETAAEVNEGKIAEIPGFGRNLTDRLVNWRERLEAKFRFEPIAVTDPLEVRKIDRELAARRTKLMKELRVGIAALEKESHSVRDNRDALWKRLEIAFNVRMLAQHTYQAAGRS